MRNVFVLLSLFLGCIACSSPQKAYVVVENFPGGECVVDVLSRMSDSRYEAVSDAQSRAVITLPGASVDSLYVMALNGRSKIFSAIPGDTLYLVFEEDMRKLNGCLKFKEANEYNRYLERWEEQMKGVIPKIEFNFSIKNAEYNMRFLQPIEQAFCKENLEKVLTLENECLQELKESNIQNQRFLEVQKKRIQHVCWYLNTCILKFTDSNVGMKLPIDAHKLLDGVDLNDRSLMDFWQLSLLLKNYFIGKRRFIGVEGAFDEYLSLEAEKIAQEEICEFFVLDQLDMLLQEDRLECLDVISTACEKHVKSGAGRKRFLELKTKILQKIKEHPFNGKPAMDFAFEDQYGRTVKLADFKGKYLLIDVWATWCGPCKKEALYMHDLEKEFADKGMTFVSLSIDPKSAQKTWVKMVGDSSIALFGTNDYNTPFVRHYGIEYIPHFLLIGPDGTMLSCQTRKPSDPLLRKFLIQLLDI